MSKIKATIAKATPMEKKIFMALIVGLFLMSGATASWYLGYESSGVTGYSISSDGVIYADNFGVDSIDTTLSGYSKKENITIDNSDGLYNVTAEITINSADTDLGDGCNITGDVEVLVEYNDQEIQDGEEFTIQSGLTAINVTTIVEERACPQKFNTSVNLLY